MRWLLVFLAACGFEHGELPAAHDAAGSGTRMIDARMIDARPIDAAASSACVQASTQTSGGHHYFKTSNLSWAASQGACVALGGHLAKVETSAENGFITTAFTSGGYVWIGLQDPTNTDTYVWYDLTPLGLSYNGFPNMTPPASSGNCVDTNGAWDAFNCGSTVHGGVCECE